MTQSSRIIDERVHLDATFSEEQARTDALFRSIGDGIIATDEFGRIIRVNPAALKLLGYNENEMLGKWYPNVFIVHDEDGTPISLIDRPITRAFLTGASISQKVLCQTKNGDLVPININVSPIIHHSKPIGAINVFRDISLDYKIDRMKSEFISLASHQLRTPLSTIKIYSHMLLDSYMGQLNQEQKSTLRTIVKASNRMNQLISTLLNIASMESGAISVVLSKINLGHLVEESVQELRLLANSREVSLALNLPKKPLTLRTDPLMTKEILVNLIGNAIKYTPKNGTVEIDLKNRRYDVLLSVKDSGVGIPEAVTDQIFTKFFRGHNVVRRETSGTGLGLYLVKGLVDALNGKVWFESKENVGSTFYVAFPKAHPKNGK